MSIELNIRDDGNKFNEYTKTDISIKRGPIGAEQVKWFGFVISEGLSKERLTINFANKIAQIAISTDEPLKEKWKWQELTIKRPGSKNIKIWINVASARKRLGLLGYKPQEIAEMLSNIENIKNAAVKESPKNLEIQVNNDTGENLIKSDALVKRPKKIQRTLSYLTIKDFLLRPSSTFTNSIISKYLLNLQKKFPIFRMKASSSPKHITNPDKSTTTKKAVPDQLKEEFNKSSNYIASFKQKEKAPSPLVNQKNSFEWKNKEKKLESLKILLKQEEDNFFKLLKSSEFGEAKVEMIKSKRKFIDLLDTHKNTFSAEQKNNENFEKLKNIKMTLIEEREKFDISKNEIDLLNGAHKQFLIYSKETTNKYINTKENEKLQTWKNIHNDIVGTYDIFQSKATFIKEFKGKLTRSSEKIAQIKKEIKDLEKQSNEIIDPLQKQANPLTYQQKGQILREDDEW